MSYTKTHNHYSACQIKFAFDVSFESPLSWCEYFGWDDEYDMLYTYCNKYLDSNSVSFIGTDFGGAKLTILFEAYCEPRDFQECYNKVLELLSRLSESPEYNTSQLTMNNMLDALEEEGIVFDTDEPTTEVFLKYNKLTLGFSTYQENLNNMKLYHNR